MRGRVERHLGDLVSPPGQKSIALNRVIQTLSQQDDDALPPEFTWRDYAIFLLTIAAQIEHSLMVQYLYAGYSLGGPQVPEEKREAVASWRQLILGIAKEEMGHLITVQNTLRFLGAPLSLDREDYPWDSSIAPYPFTLERLTRASLAKYIIVESPETWPDDVPPALREEIESLASGYGGSQINRVGALYDKLIGVIGDAARLPTAALHPETRPAQASWDEWGRGYGKGARGSSLAGTATTPDVLVMPMASRADALAALRAVAEQGEAPVAIADAEGETSHFLRFLRMFREFPTDGSWDPARPLPDNPLAPLTGDPAAPGFVVGPGQTLITDPEAGVWAHLCNIRYRMLLTYLAHTFLEPRGEDDRRGVVVNRMFGEMYNLRAVAALLVDLPVAIGGAERCGPPFQMPYTLQLPHSEAAYWTLHLDLIAAAAALLRKAIDIGSGPRAEYAAVLLDLDAAAGREMTLYAGAPRGADRKSKVV